MKKLYEVTGVKDILAKLSRELSYAASDLNDAILDARDSIKNNPMRTYYSKETQAASKELVAAIKDAKSVLDGVLADFGVTGYSRFEPKLDKIADSLDAYKSYDFPKISLWTKIGSKLSNASDKVNSAREAFEESISSEKPGKR